MQIPENLLQYVIDEAKRVHHGRIIIELNETRNKVDVVTESRERFERVPGSNQVKKAKPATGHKE